MAFSKRDSMPSGESPMNGAPRPAPVTLPPHPTHGCVCTSCWGGNFGKKIIMTLVGVLLVYLIMYVGTLMRNGIKKFEYIGQAPQNEHVITVNGYGKVTGKNDIAVTTIGYTNTDPDVGKAQLDNKQVMDKVLADLKGMGIEDKDLQSTYSIYPSYNYTQDKGQQLKGYTVDSRVRVKIRDLSKISDVLSLAGKYGANQIDGLNFTIDDPQNLRDEARQKAIADAGARALELERTLGVRFAQVVSYSESEGGTPTPVPYYAAEGVGGSGEAAPAPAVASGSQDEEMNISITYRLQ